MIEESEDPNDDRGDEEKPKVDGNALETQQVRNGDGLPAMDGLDKEEWPKVQYSIIILLL